MKKIKGIISILLSFMLMFSGTYIGEISSFADSAKATSKMISIGNFEDELKVIEKSDGEVVNPLYEGESIKIYSPKPAAAKSNIKVFSCNIF